MIKMTLCALLLAFCAGTAAIAAQDPTYTGPESSAEKAFVASMQGRLMTCFPTASAARKAGYVRYTNVDDTGAISYANFKWQSADTSHPSQLWYDRAGNLLGADYSVPVTASATRPRRWGVTPGRWALLDSHLHWLEKNSATGALTYGHWMPAAKFAAAGGNVDHPSPKTLVAMHKSANANAVVSLFHFPAVWDLVVWVKPNPLGAFAEKNPAVTP